LQDTALYNSMCKNAIKHVRGGFTWNKVAATIHLVYSKVLTDVQKPARVPVMQKIADKAALLNIMNLLPAFKSSVV
jgi:D-inositol-3-phosphate glycosyltransferase